MAVNIIQTVGLLLACAYTPMLMQGVAGNRREKIGEARILLWAAGWTAAVAPLLWVG